MATVEGTVTHQGKPGPGAVGKIEPDGSFQMQTTGRQGVAIGRYVVTVHCRDKFRGKQQHDEKTLKVPKSRIPKKYSTRAKSPLRVEVKEGHNEWPIVLD